MSHEHWVFMLSPYESSVGVLFQKRVRINFIASTSHCSKPLWPRQKPKKNACLQMAFPQGITYLRIPTTKLQEIPSLFFGDRRDPLPKSALEDDIFLALSFSNMEYKSYIGWKTMLDPLVAILGQWWQLFINTPYMESLETLPTFSFWIVDFLGHTVCGGPPNSWKGSCFSVPSCPPPSNPRPAKTVSQLKWISNMPRTVKV